VVVLALASFSSMAMSAPHRDRLVLLADLCGVANVSQFDQYMAAIKWAEQGGPVPEALTVSCVENSSDLSASLADLGGDSGVRWEQYMAAINGTAIAAAPSTFSAAERPLPLFEQYEAAREALWEPYLNGTDQAPSTVSAAEKPLPLFEQYQAAVNSTGKVRTFAPQRPTGEYDLQLFAQYLAAVANAGYGPTFASGADWGMPK